MTEPRIPHPRPEQPSTGADTSLNHAVADLVRKFGDSFSTETIREVLRESYDMLAVTARVHAFLPLLATRFTTERLAAIAKNRGAIVPTTPEVLFVCVHNAGRSQMAAALLHHHAAGRITVRSAGSAPADTINPAVHAAMAELGIDLSTAFPKPLTDEVVQAADVVITMGCGDACPVYPGKRYLNWELTDPAGRGVDDVRAIRDDIDDRVRALLDELVLVSRDVVNDGTFRPPA